MLKKSTPSQRGEMSRLTLEIKSGVFIANLNARVRDKLWEKICKEWNLSSILLYTTNNEQGYSILSHGHTNLEVIDLDGIQLLAKTKKNKTTPDPEELE